MSRKYLDMSYRAIFIKIIFRNYVILIGNYETQYFSKFHVQFKKLGLNIFSCKSMKEIFGENCMNYT